MNARDDQAYWLVELMDRYSKIKRINISDGNSDPLPLRILGYAYKKDLPLTDGSVALLIENQIRFRLKRSDVMKYDPMIDIDDDALERFIEPAVYLIGINHTYFENIRFPKGSVVIDPWRMIKEQDGVFICPIGKDAAWPEMRDNKNRSIHSDFEVERVH